jgi:hypothetical protein
MYSVRGVYKIDLNFTMFLVRSDWKFKCLPNAAVGYHLFFFGILHTKIYFHEYRRQRQNSTITVKESETEMKTLATF